MPARLVLCLLTLGILGPAYAGQGQTAEPSPRLSRDWKRVHSKNFEAVGNASAGELKDAVAELEGLRAALATLYPGLRLEAPVPTRIVVFRDPNAFHRYRPRDSRGRPISNVGGYFTTTPHANFIVFGASSGPAALTTVFHEFTHYVMSRNMSGLPLWLNEGLAEFFSTFERGRDGRGVVGRPPEWRLRALRGATFIPLRNIVSPKEMEKLWQSDRISLFYSESWALVHYLMVGRPQTRSPIGAYLNALGKTSSPDAAFKMAYGVDIAGMEEELRQYVHRFLFKGLAISNVEADNAASADAMREAAVRSLQGELLLHNGAYEEAEKELEAALAIEPDHVPAQIGLARLKTATDRREEGIASLTRIADAAPSDFSARFYLALALTGARRHEEAIRAYDAALQINAESPSAWLGLSTSAMALGRDAQSEATFARAVQLESSPEMFRGRAYSALGYGRDAAVAPVARAYISRVGWGEESAQYTALAAAIACRRAGQPAAADAILEEAEEAVPPKSWTSTVLQFLRGGLDEKAFLERAKEPGEKTEAHAYIGFAAEIDGHRDKALEHFRWVVDQGAKNYVEYGMAKMEVERLEGASAAAVK